MMMTHGISCLVFRLLCCCCCRLKTIQLVVTSSYIRYVCKYEKVNTVQQNHTQPNIHKCTASVWRITAPRREISGQLRHDDKSIILIVVR